jgi:hypothetical protein
MPRLLERAMRSTRTILPLLQRLHTIFHRCLRLGLHWRAKYQQEKEAGAFQAFRNRGHESGNG